MHSPKRQYESATALAMTQQNHQNVFEFDWKADVQPLDLYKPQAPNFIRLFILHRILKQFVKNDVQLLSLFKKGASKNNQRRVDKIISSLIKYGIQTYMTDYYNEKDDSQTIDLIFDNIILKYFDKEYHKITQYVDKSDLSLEYSEKVFNTNDLMCLIFQFLFDNTDNINIVISLVCSQWLYHSFDKKSNIFNGNLPFKLLMKISKFNPKNEPKHQLERYKSQLQRLYKVQSLNIHMGKNFVVTSKFLSHFAVFNHIEQLEIWLGDIIRSNTSKDRLNVLKTIIQQCSNQIKTLKISAAHFYGDQIKLPVLTLDNLESLFMFQQCFPIIFSKKLKSLTIGFKEETTYLNNEWMKLVIDKCEFSNIKHLKIYNVLFANANHQAINEGDDKDINLIKQFATKFIALQKIDFVLKKCNYLSSNLWNIFTKSLKSTSLKNKTLITSDTFTSQLQNVTIAKTQSFNYGNRQQKLVRDIFDDLQSNPSDDYKITYDINDDERRHDCIKWNIAIYGPQGTPYENGIFDFGLEFRRRFRLDGPLIEVKTKIFHPNVSFGGKVRFSMYCNWDKSNTIRQLLDDLANLLREPDVSQLQSKHAWELYRDDKAKFDKTARRITKHFAIP